MFLFLLYFWSYKFSLGEQNRPLKNLSDHRLLNGSVHKFWTVITLVCKMSFQLRLRKKQLFIFSCFKTFKILIKPNGINDDTHDPILWKLNNYRLNGGWSVISTCRYLYNNSYLSNSLHSFNYLNEPVKNISATRCWINTCLFTSNRQPHSITFCHH